MRCPSCDASVEGANAFPGGEVRCASCGAAVRVAEKTPVREGAAPSPYRAAEARARLSPEPEAIACPMCSGPVAANARVCPRCDVKLESVRCAHCFALQHTGARRCAHCGHDLELEPLLDPTDAPCPSCDRLLEAIPGSPHGIHECAGCGGLFLDHTTLARITEDREKGGPILATQPFEVPRAKHVDTVIRYVKCPLCHQAMNRANFGRKSGVIVDVCKSHGTWFDAGELTSAIEFVANGGLDGTRRREREDADQSARDKNSAVAVAQAAMMGEAMNESYQDARQVGRTLALVEGVIRALLW